MGWRNKVLSALFGFLKPRPLDSPAHIERAVRRRRRVAENLGLTRGFVDFVHGYAFHMPAWFNAPSNRSAVPPIITGAREIGYHAVELTVNGRAFVFRRCNKFRDDRDGEGIELTLQVEGQIVFEVIATVHLGWR